MKLSKIYKYYRNKDLSLNERFVDSEKDVNKSHDKLNKLNSQKQDMVAVLKEACMYYLGHVKVEKYYIEWGILDFTSKEGYTATGNDRERYFSNAYRGKVNFKVEDDKELHIKSKYGDLDVKKLSAQYPKLLEKVPSLETNERAGMCHKLAIGVATAFVKECEVVTGTIWTLHKKDECLHSWTEIEIDGKECLMRFLRKNNIISFGM